MNRGDRHYDTSGSSDDDDDEDDIVITHKNRAEQKDTRLWDSFQDPPVEQTTGSSVSTERIETFIKILKVFVFIFVFIVILITGTVSKISLLFMTSHIKKNVRVPFCDILQPEKEFNAIIPVEQRIAWIWAVIFAYSLPELGTLFRASRICFFKNIKLPSYNEIGLVAVFETLHVIGLALLVITILPNLDVIQGVMLTNAVCIIPTIISILSNDKDETKRSLKFVLDILAICSQLTAFILWPIMNNNLPELWTIPLAITLISFHWWENYVSNKSRFRFIVYLANMRSNLFDARYYIYLYVSPWKILLFIVTTMLLSGEDFQLFFTEFTTGWGEHQIMINESVPLYSDAVALPDLSSVTSSLTLTNIESTHLAILWVLVTHSLGSYFCYVFTKFACKIQIQTFSFAFPVNLIVPITISILLVFSGLHATDTCYFSNILPPYLFFNPPPVYGLSEYLLNECTWIWLFWLLSQTWITKHIWIPKSDKNASTDKLFVTPLYNSLLIDQSLAMNRRREDQEFIINKEDLIEIKEDKTLNKIDAHVKKLEGDIKPHDQIPQVFICATMWHENKDEMMEFLKSILRLDEDQCARRMAMKYIQSGEIDSDYYDLETHIFFDDAFLPYDDKIYDSAPINEYVKLLINNLEVAATKVYKTKITIYPPTKVVTPYGGRLVWTLPGRTKMVAHLKDKNKIRHKKRWSQVMYMYYLLGYRIMQLCGTTERKYLIAQNTYLLALDGDIDFQPRAVHLLIGRMKVDPDLGAACGRIHPVGDGPMVWYQRFEYAIGHWLQKATEHIIGCVLCSPGCFSLFRGRALMETSVMKKYTTKSDRALHYVQYDQGEDRWLCTLLLKQRFRVEYSAASDAYTHSPEGFNEFYNQRRRWVPSTMANIIDLLSDAKRIVKTNNSISMLYIFYQFLLMIGTILGPGTIFLMMVGALVAVFSIDIWTSFLWNFTPLCIFMTICYVCKQKYQLMAAFFISAVYSLVMMAVLIGIIIQVIDDGILSPTSLFFFCVAAQIIITGLLHPQEAGALICGVVYYITIPSMYMLLVIYSLFNMNDVSWGTRENPTAAAQAKTDQKPEQQKTNQTKFQKMFGFLRPNNEEEGSLDISCAGLFRCMMCTHPKNSTEQAQLITIGDQLNDLNKKLQILEMKLTGDIIAMRSDEELPTVTTPPPSTKEEEQPEKSTNNLPDWLYDVDLRNGETDSLTNSEEQFWGDLIEKYLKPLEDNEEEKKKVSEALRVLRDLSVFAFVMINALFVLIVFLLQINKEDLHIQWPFNAKHFITYDHSSSDIQIKIEYLELEPIGLVFVLFFGIILFVQFGAMLVHRFATISQILASTTLDWYCGKRSKEMSPHVELRGAAVDIARKLQRPKQWDDETDANLDDQIQSQNTVGRRNTITKMLIQRNNSKENWSNLETNFKRRYLKDGILDLGARYTFKRKTMDLLHARRQSVVDLRQKRKSIKLSLHNPNANNQNNNNNSDNFSRTKWQQPSTTTAGVNDNQHQHQSQPPAFKKQSIYRTNNDDIQLRNGKATYDNHAYQIDNYDDDEYDDSNSIEMSETAPRHRASRIRFNDGQF